MNSRKGKTVYDSGKGRSKLETIVSAVGDVFGLGTRLTKGEPWHRRTVENSSRRHFRFESFEPRILMSGDVDPLVTALSPVTLRRNGARVFRRNGATRKG